MMAWLLEILEEENINSFKTEDYYENLYYNSKWKCL